MLKSRLYIAIGVIATVLGVSCGSKSGVKDFDVKSVGLASESDSLAYIIGMSVADQLIKMDSTINYGVVCRAIMEHSAGKAVFTREDAQQEYLRYLLYVEPERRRGYEETFLANLAEKDRDYTRTKSGLTYHIEVIGNESLTPKTTNDWINLKYRIERVGGETIYPLSGGASEEIEGTLDDFVEGVREAIKMIGEGGKIRAWIPSKLAYGESGDTKLGVEPIETLYYEIELVKVDKGNASSRKSGSLTEF